MNRMHAIVHAAAARLPAAEPVPARLLQRLAARNSGYLRQRYAAGTLPSRFQVA